MTVRPDDQADLIAAYYRYQATRDETLEWAWEAVDVAGFDDPDGKWALLLALLAAAPDAWQIGLLAARPLEDFLRMHGRRFALTIENEAARNERLRMAISMAWVDDRPDGQP